MGNVADFPSPNIVRIIGWGDADAFILPGSTVEAQNHPLVRWWQLLMHRRAAERGLAQIDALVRRVRRIVWERQVHDANAQLAEYYRTINTAFVEAIRKDHGCTFQSGSVG